MSIAKRTLFEQMECTCRECGATIVPNVSGMCNPCVLKANARDEEEEAVEDDLEVRDPKGD